MKQEQTSYIGAGHNTEIGSWVDLGVEWKRLGYNWRRGGRGWGRFGSGVVEVG